ncbi:MAG: CHAT domain-containing tetratricopeptide repeat protein [bacterium]
MANEQIRLAVRRFLRDGSIRGVAEPDLAVACDRQIQETARKSLKSAVKLAGQFAARATPLGGPLALAANRTLARVSHMAGSHEAALKAYLEARRLARRDRLVRARIDRALVDVYMYLGHAVKARRCASLALITFRQLSADSDYAQTQVNLANLLHRQDRHREAEKLYREAAEFFDVQGNQLASARCYYNRANTLVQLFDLRQADELYQRAAEIYDKEGFELDANDARYGLAWLNLLAGQMHTALLDLAKCEAVYRRGGDPRGEALCTLDRAEVYLMLGLYPDARENARLAERKSRKLKLRYEAAKAALFRGQAAFALGVRAEAQRAVTRARAAFSAEKNAGFLGVVALLAAGLASPESVRRRELHNARRRFATAQLPLWEAVCDLRLVGADWKVDSALQRLHGNPAVKVVPHLYAMWQTALGDRLAKLGRPAEARRRWEDAADRLDSVRAQLPPLELRTTFARQERSPHLSLIESELEANPQLAAAWLERYKTAGLWSPLAETLAPDPARSRVAQSLDALARHVALTSLKSAVVSEERKASPTAARAKANRLQKDVLHNFIALEKSLRTVPTGTDELIHDLRSVSEKLPVVQLHVQAGDIVALAHHLGETTVHRSPGGRQRLRQAMRRWRFILETELLTNRFPQAANTGVEESYWQDLGSWLWEPLGIEPDCPEVLLIPEGELANLPFPALRIDGRPLLERHQFTIAHSIRHYLAAQGSRSSSDRIDVFVGTSADLANVDRELEHLVGLSGGAATVHRPCRREDWLAAGSARLWHFAGHATLRSDNPFYSYLELEDGPLFAADLRLKRCPVDLVTLAACRTGEQVALPGEEATGLVRSFLELGARNVIASFWPTADESTVLWTETFYDSIFNGGSINSAARCAASTVREFFPSAYHWAAYAVFGAGALGETYAS